MKKIGDLLVPSFVSENSSASAATNYSICSNDIKSCSTTNYIVVSTNSSSSTLLPEVHFSIIAPEEECLVVNSTLNYPVENETTSEVFYKIEV